jgi:hypothetical protein
MPHDISTFVRLESFNCGRDTRADLVEVPWTGSSRPHLELGERWFDGIHVGRSDRGVHGRLFVDGQVVLSRRGNANGGNVSTSFESLGWNELTAVRPPRTIAADAWGASTLAQILHGSLEKPRG